MGVPIIRIIVFWGLYWGPPFWETPICAPPRSAFACQELTRYNDRLKDQLRDQKEAKKL